MWLFSVLTSAHLAVVLECATEIEAAALGVAPRHYRAMEVAIEAFMRSSNARELPLHDPLRRAQLTRLINATSLGSCSG